MATGLNEAGVQKKFEGITGAQDSIQSVSLWIIHHKAEKDCLVNVWLKVLKKAPTSQKLLLFYLCNDVVQNCKRKQAPVFVDGFKSVLLEGLQFVREPTIKPKVVRILNIWEERNVYKSFFINQLKAVLDGKTIELESKPQRPLKPPKAQKAEVQANTVQPNETKQKLVKIVNPQLFAEFKPQAMIHKVTAFRKLELENELKQKQLSKVVFDESSIETIKLLKDKSQGREFTNNFEDGVTNIETTVKYLEQDVKDRGEIIELAETSEFFYDEQYKEAKIVANAYRNFGTRINNMKRKLDDIKSKFPVTPSPVSSPTLDAPSPEPTPPQSDPNDYTDTVDMEMDSDEERKTRKAKNDPRAEYTRKSVSSVFSHAKNDPRSEYARKSEASVFSQGQSSSTDIEPNRKHDLENRKKANGEDKYQHKSHSRLRSVVSVVTPAEKEKQKAPEPHKKTQSHGKRDSIEEVEGGCSTPVQDEATVDTPAQKENPIDFLTKLLSKTNSSVPVTGASFLQNLSLLTSTVKSQFEQNKVTKELPDAGQDIGNAGDELSNDAQHSWAAWEAEEPVLKTNSSSNIPTIPEYSPLAPVSHIMSHSQTIHGNMTSQTSSIQGPLTVPIASHTVPPVQPRMAPDIHPSLGSVIPPSMIVLSNQTQYPETHGGGIPMPPHLMQPVQPTQHPPGMFQQSPVILTPTSMMMGQSQSTNHIFSFNDISNSSPELILQSPVINRNNFNFNGSHPMVLNQTPPVPMSLSASQNKGMLDDESGLDDILNQIVTGEGFQKSSAGEKENNPSENTGSKEATMMGHVSMDGAPNLDIDTSSSFLSPTPGKSILRKSKSVLQEVPLTSSQPAFVSSAVNVHSKSEFDNSSEYGESHPQFIRTLESVERDPTEDIEDFTVKLNTGAVEKGHSYGRNPIRPNLTCLTPQEDDMSEHGMMPHEAPRPIMAVEGVRAIESLVSRSDPDPNQGRDISLEREVHGHPRFQSFEPVKRILTVDDRLYDAPPIHHPPHHPPHHHHMSHPLPHPSSPHPRSRGHHDPYDRQHRNPYARYPPESYDMYPMDHYNHHSDHYGPPPPKRPYPPERNQPRHFYRY